MQQFSVNVSIFDVLWLDVHVSFPSLAFCTNGTVRISNKGTQYGAVEVCIDSTWRIICSSSWSYEEAAVACRELGFSKYGEFMSMHGIAMTYIIIIIVIIELKMNPGKGAR